MATPARAGGSGNAGNGSASAAGRRKSILDLAPLELDCMNALWPMGEATVREVQEALTEVRPRAYTTIMTILDRLAHKGVVTRRKIGRAYLYRANLTPDGARESAVQRLVNGFFGGSREQLMQHLRENGAQERRAVARVAVAAAATPSATRDDDLAKPVAAASAISGGEALPDGAANEVELDDTLL
jgi:predicted transcriptional regulator